jgi:hypothetical protein
MKNHQETKIASTSKKILDKVVSSYYECNPKDNRFTFDKRPKCIYCGTSDAQWENSILKEYCCNDCVPRGCSCRLYKIKNQKNFSIENFSYEKDEFGDELPCEDWHFF